MPFSDKLLHVAWRRTACPGLKHRSTIDQRHDRQHFCTCAQFEDREEIGQIITQHVAGCRNGVQTLFGALQRVLHRLHRRQNLDVEAFRIVLR